MCDDEADVVSEGSINMAPLSSIENLPEELTGRGRMVWNVLPVGWMSTLFGPIVRKGYVD